MTLGKVHHRRKTALTGILEKFIEKMKDKHAQLQEKSKFPEFLAKSDRFNREDACKGLSQIVTRFKEWCKTYTKNDRAQGDRTHKFADRMAQKLDILEHKTKERMSVKGKKCVVKNA